MVGSYIISVKRQYPKGEPFSISKLLKQLATSIWALAAILIVVVGVVAGVFTATESAAIAVIYSLLVSVFIYKGLTWKGVWKALDGCIDTLSIVLILISTSSIFGYCLTQLHVPDLASSAILGLTDNKIIIFLLVDLIILLLGCIMDMSPIILITTPILLYVPDHPDHDTDPSADRLRTWHGSDPVRYHHGPQLRYRSSDTAGRSGPLYRIRRREAQDGTGRQSDAPILSVHAGRADPHHVYSGDFTGTAEPVDAGRVME